MSNGNEQPKPFKPTELDWFIVDLFCKEIIGPRHEIEREWFTEDELMERREDEKEEKQ